MSFTISCPSCQRTLRVPENLLGQAVKCPSCGHNFTAPEQVEDEAPPPASNRPSRRSSPPPEDDFEEESPRPSRRRAREEEYLEADDEPPRRSRRSSPEKPGKVQAIAIMLLVGGILACLLTVSVHSWAGFLSFGICCIPGTYCLIMGIIAIIRGSQLLGDKAYLYPPPQGIAIMMIINIINADIVNLVLGIIVLVFLADDEVKDYFQG